jgi:hypothetical protein
MLTGVRNARTILLHRDLDNLIRLQWHLNAIIVSEFGEFFDILSVIRPGKDIDEYEL